MCAVDSFVWVNFKKQEENETAKCTLCEQIIKCAGSSVGVLWRHLESQHGKVAEKSLESASKKRPRTLDGYFSKASKSLSEIQVEMAAFNVFTFHSKCPKKRLTHSSRESISNLQAGQGVWK